MPERESIKMNAPYLYMAKESENKYWLFVYVPLAADYTATFSTAPSEDNGNKTTHIEVEIKHKPGALASFEKEAYRLPSNGNSKKVVVKTNIEGENGKKEFRKTTLAYSDCADVIHSIQNFDDEVAYNCPYIYLEKGNGNSIFNPYVLIPLQDYSFNGNSHILENGNCHVEIDLVKSKGAEGLLAGELEINEIDYDDTETKGNFQVGVTLSPAFSSSSNNTINVQRDPLGGEIGVAMMLLFVAEEEEKRKAKTDNANA